MQGYKYKLIYIIDNQYDVKFSDSKTRLKVFAERTMKTNNYIIITL